MTSKPSPDPLAQRARRLGLYGLLARWQELGDQPWVVTLIESEEAERSRRSLERRIRTSKVGRFKSIADFNWSWPDKIDRPLIEELMQLGFIEEATNVILAGPNGVGKSTIAQNIVHQALLCGHTVLCASASAMLNDLAAQDTSTALARRLRRYVNPAVLLIDEVGYLSYDSRAADLLFEVVSRRHEQRSIVLTTNKPFAEWNEVFPNSSSVTALLPVSSANRCVCRSPWFCRWTAWACARVRRRWAIVGSGRRFARCWPSSKAGRAGPWTC